jgi:hypothetical protein
MVKCGLRLVLVILVLFAVQVSILAYPQMFVHNKVESGTITLYYDGAPNADLEQLAWMVDQRLQGCGYYDSTRADRVFLIHSDGIYDILVRLSLLHGRPQGFNLSLFGNSFVSVSRVRALGESSGGLPRFSIWEGDLAHTIAHEVAHQYVTDRLGRGVWRRLPHWKREGMVEYLANIGVIRQDTSATIPNRLDVLNNDHVWRATQGWSDKGWDRIHYEAGLLIEFLIDIQGYILEDVIAESVTDVDTRAAMLVWRAGR